MDLPFALVYGDKIIQVIESPCPFAGPDGTQHPVDRFAEWTDLDWSENLAPWSRIPARIDRRPDPDCFTSTGCIALLNGDHVHVTWSVENKPLDAARKAACDRIDRMAEAVRGRYLTAGAGQAMVYQQKVAEARDHQAGGTGPWPHLTAEVGITAVDEAGVATVILATEAAWLEISALIEAARLKAKRDISGASLDQIAEIVAAVEWPE